MQVIFFYFSDCKNGISEEIEIKMNVVAEWNYDEVKKADILYFARSAAQYYF